MKSRVRNRMCCVFLVMAMIITGINLPQGAQAATKKVALSSSKISLNVGKSKKISVKNKPKGAKVTWKSKNKKIATVKNGKIKAVKKGKTAVVCKVTYKKKGMKIKKTLKVTVTVKKKVTSVVSTSAPTAVATIPVATATPENTPEPSATATPIPAGSTIQENFNVLSGDEMIVDMGAGWNLGNTMDGHTGFTPSETAWQSVKTTKALIKSVHDLGFNTVRVPVTWGTMIDDENGYAINEKWISRVQDIVDYCISQDMYVIINIHHDGAEQTGWLRIASEDQDGLAAKYEGVWKNIASAFKNYNEHLIFESMNEVKGNNMSVVKENTVIMKLNQIFVNTVRATGSNNAKRWLMVPGKYNYIDSVCNKSNRFSLPEDSEQNRLIVSVHDYSPWSFCGTESTSSSSATEQMISNNDLELQPLYDTFTSKGIPVVVGEYGCINKNNAEERAYYLEGMNRIFKKYKLVGVYWDQGWYDRSQNPDYSFSIIDRTTGNPIDKTVTDGLLRGFAGLTGDLDSLTKSPEVIPVEQLVPSETKVTLKMEETVQLTATHTPETSNDVILWKTKDASVATVYNGKIRAKGVGSTVVTLYSQNSDVAVDIPVTVEKKEVQNPCTAIMVTKDTYDFTVDDTAWLDVTVAPENAVDMLYCRSMDENVVTVSSIGKLVAVGAGETTVSVESASGCKKEIAVSVHKTEKKQSVDLAVNVYYNDKTHSYYSNEVSSDVISVTENGQYQLSFDCTKDLSENAVKAGVTNLNKVTAIYIKDNAVTKGEASTSPLVSCNIRYDKVEIDGVEMTRNVSDFKSALKDSGVFDTNDPVNAWDGSAINEVQTSNGAVTFTALEDPKKITITFTLEDLVFVSEDE